LHIPSDPAFHNEVLYEVQAKRDDNRMRLISKIEDIIHSVKEYFNERNETIKMGLCVTIHNTDRLINGLRQTFELFLDLVRSSHTYAVRAMLFPVLESFKKNINDSLNELKKLRSLFSEPTDNKRFIIFLTNTDNNIDEFRHELNELLLDFVRSDRQYIEGRTLLHFSAGSATKLLLAYSRVLRRMVEIIRDKNQDRDSTYAFFLSSGGVSETTAKSYFKHILPNIKDDRIYENQLLQLKIPERILYRPGASIYLLCHEIIHYVGIRHREARFINILNSVYAAAINSLGELYEGWDNVISEELDFITEEDDKRRLVDSAIAFLKKRRQLTQEALIDKLQLLVDAEINSEIKSEAIDRSIMLSFNLSDVVLSVVCDNFVPRYDLNDSELPLQMSSQFHKDMLEMWIHIKNEYDKLPKMRTVVSLNIGMNIEFARANNTMPTYVSRHFDKVVGNRYKMTEHDGEDVTTGQFGDKPLHWSLAETIDEYVDIYREVFVDTITCLYLNCPAQSYLGVFLYLYESPLLMLPLIPSVVMRFGAMLCIQDEEIHNAMDIECDNEFYEIIYRRINLYSDEMVKAKICPLTDGEDLPTEKIGSFLKHIVNILVNFRRAFYKTRIAIPLVDYAIKCRDTHKKMIGRLDHPQKLILDQIRSLFWDDFVAKRDASKEVQSWKYMLYFWLDSIQEAMDQ
jgi:hypothetical protein